MTKTLSSKSAENKAIFDRVLKEMTGIFINADSSDSNYLWLQRSPHRHPDYFGTRADFGIQELIVKILGREFGITTHEGDSLWTANLDLSETILYQAPWAMVFSAWEGTENRHRIAQGEVKVPRAYGTCLSRVSKGKATDSILIGRLEEKFYALRVDRSTITSLSEVEARYPKFSIPMMSSIPREGLLVASNERACSEICKPFREKGEKFMNESSETLIPTTGSCFGDVFGVIQGQYGAYANTGHGFVHDYFSLSHLFKVLGGHVIDLAEEKGRFLPTHAQRPLLFLHPLLKRAKMKEYLGVYLPKERADHIVSLMK